MDISKLYDECPVHEFCTGCSQLKKPKPRHAITDYDDLEEADVLFLSDSFTFSNGRANPFSSSDLDLLTSVLVKSSLPGDCSVSFSASVKCPKVRESDMKTSDLAACRSHLYATIEKVKPRLVFMCGNLSLKMLTKKSGITTKRGSSFEVKLESGFETVAVPVYHPYAVQTEPRLRFIFNQDILNAVDKIIVGKKSEETLYTSILSMKDLRSIEWMVNTEEDLAVDTETTGLNFLQDTLNTIAFSTRENNYALPLMHKDSPWEEDELVEVLEFVRRVMENPNNKKILHNAKFDLKFLHSVDIHPVNVYDTKLMAHLWNEDIPKSLKELVKLFFPEEIDQL